MENLERNTISFNKLREIMRNPMITPMQKCILVNLLLYAGIKGDCFPSQQTIANDLGCGARHVRDNLKELKKVGCIIGWKKRGYSQSNEYFFNEELYFRIDNAKRNPTSSLSGDTVPHQSGTPLPPKMSQESNQQSSSKVQLLFAKVANKRCNSTEIEQLNQLCREYLESEVSDAIKEAGKRNKPFVAVGLIKGILSDWKKDGKPPPKPEFNPCGMNGCNNGLIAHPDKNSYSLCDCREKYETNLEQWESYMKGGNSLKHA